MSRQMQKTQKPAHKPVRHGDRRGRLVRVGACTLAGLLAALMLLSVVFSALPIRAASQLSLIHILCYDVSYSIIVRSYAA